MFCQSWVCHPCWCWLQHPASHSITRSEVRGQCLTPNTADQSMLCVFVCWEGEIVYTVGHNGRCSLPLLPYPTPYSPLPGYPVLWTSLDSNVCFFPKVSNCNKLREEASEHKHREGNVLCQSQHSSYSAKVIISDGWKQGSEVDECKHIENWRLTWAGLWSHWIQQISNIDTRKECMY